MKALLGLLAMSMVVLWSGSARPNNELGLIRGTGKAPAQLSSKARRLKGAEFTRLGDAPHGGWARCGGFLYYFVFGVQLLVLVVQVGTLFKDAGCSRKLLGLDLLGCILTAIGLFVLGDVSSGYFLGDNLHVFERGNVTVVATDATTAGQDGCFQFNSAEIVEECVSAVEAFKDRCFGAPKTAGAVASLLSNDSCLQTNALGSCVMFATRTCTPPGDTGCIDKLIEEMRGSTPATTFMNTLFSSKLAPITYVVGNVMRLVFLGPSSLGLLPEMPAAAQWGLSVVQDGLCVASMIFVSQTSFDNDCLEMTFIGDLHSFLALSNYALYFLYYGWFCLLAACYFLCPCCADNFPLICVCILGGLVLAVEGAAAWVYSIVIGIYDAASSGETQTLISTAFMVTGVLSGLYPVVCSEAEKEAEDEPLTQSTAQD